MCREKTNSNCPTCDQEINKLIKTIPGSSKSHTTLICKLTGKPMVGDNYPMALPNGQVYSIKVTI